MQTTRSYAAVTGSSAAKHRGYLANAKHAAAKSENGDANAALLSDKQTWSRLVEAEEAGVEAEGDNEWLARLGDASSASAVKASRGPRPPPATKRSLSTLRTAA